MGFLFVVTTFLLYFVPLMVASKRKHHQIGAIAVINIFLGWTFIGWILALAMSLSAVKTQQ